ncbi:hypothetical protein V2K59_02105 [Pseudomonas alliivorans]|nr:hypothetical protein [Pseudomonas alliivorans]
MEMWALAKRILASADEGQSFTPSAVGVEYRQYLESLGKSELPPLEDFRNWAEDLAAQMEFVKLMEKVSNTTRGLALLGEMRRTGFGDELFNALQDHNVVIFFQSMQATIDAGEIRRILHQLDS